MSKYVILKKLKWASGQIYSAWSEKRWCSFTHSGCACPRVWAVSRRPSLDVSDPEPRQSRSIPIRVHAATAGRVARRSILLVLSGYGGGGRGCLLQCSAPYETELF